MSLQSAARIDFEVSTVHYRYVCALCEDPEPTLYLSINFPTQNIIQNYFLVIFVYHFLHVPTFSFLAETVNSSPVSP